MQPKWKLNFMLVLCIISLISIGFSAWLISDDIFSPQVNGNLLVDSIIHSKEYVYLDNTKGDLDINNIHTGITCFKYSNEGYLNNENIPVDEGYVYAYFVIDINKCKEIFQNDVHINLTLKYADNNNTKLNIFKNSSDENGYKTLFNSEILINNTTIAESNVEVDMGNYSVIKGDTTGINNYQYTFQVNFNNILNVNEDYIYFEVKYSFFATTGNYFYENIYKYMYGDMIKFALEINISDKM